MTTSVRVQKVEILPDTDDVFDIWNKESDVYCGEGNFIANNMVVHNCIPEWVERRNDPHGKWRDDVHPQILHILERTHGVIVFQEQLQALWQNIAGFTAPEAQEARKAVAKKWKDKLKPIEEKWLAGATPVLGEADAKAWWEKQVTFGRYAFNMSHSVAYCLVAFRCLWLKAYFPHEWWAAVKSYCNADKLVRYMNVARGEGVKYAPMDINNLSLNFIAVPQSPRLSHLDNPNGHVMPGLICLKGIGTKVAAAFTGEKPPITDDAIPDDSGDLDNDPDDCTASPEPNHDLITPSADEIIQATGPIESIDDFVARKGKNKLLLERLIKLGSFACLPGHTCSQAVWVYYQSKYCSGSDITALKKDLKARILDLDGWTEAAVGVERARQEQEFKALYPKRKVPKKISDWQPKADITIENVVKLYPDDFTLSEILKFEELYLGYHLHSPLDLFEVRGGRSILQARTNGEVEAVISDVFHTKTRTNMPMCKLTITDGTRTAMMIIWSDELINIDKALLRIGRGFRAKVAWDGKRRNFTLRSGCSVIRLKRKDENAS